MATAEYEDVDIEMAGEILTIRVPKGMPDDEIRQRLARARAQKPLAGPAPDDRTDHQDLLTRGLVGSGFGTQAFGTPQTKVAPGAFALRVAPGLIPNPIVAGPASAAGETIAQAAEQGVGAREGFDPLSIFVAGAIPPVVATAVRGVRGLGRTLTRFIPSKFEAAQSAALEGTKGVATKLMPEVGAAQLFKSARAAGAEPVPAGRITKILDNLDDEIDAAPIAPRLQQLRAFMDKLRSKITNGSIGLDDLMRQRRELSELWKGGAPELHALYGHGGAGAKGLIGALEEAAEQGGAGAAAARAALDTFKSDLGISTWRQLVQEATTKSTVTGSEVSVLNMAKLGRLVGKHEAELEKHLGPEGMTVIREFQRRFASLPPAQAYTRANTLASALLGLAGGVAGFGAGMPGVGVATGLLGRELILNAKLVGKNPALLNELLTGTAQTARAVGSVRVGPEAQERARGPRVRQGLPPGG